MPNLSLPEHFVQTQVNLYGDEGAAWLSQLPALIDECAQRWTLQVEPPFASLSYNFVAPATQRDGAPVVLKLGVPNPELTSEVEALRLYDGRGICRLVDADIERGVLLIERLLPGEMLSTLADDAVATAIAIEVMRQLWRPLPADHPFPTTAQWARGLERLRAEFDGGTGPFPTNLVEQAERLYTELLASSAEPVLLHGDLHHFNILTAQRQPWLAIDPKGVAGEPAYEVGAYLRNPTDAIMLDRRAQARRVDQFATELDLDRERILGWGIAQAVLSAWWCYEGHDCDWGPTLRLAALLDEIASE